MLIRRAEDNHIKPSKKKKKKQMEIRFERVRIFEDLSRRSNIQIIKKKTEGKGTPRNNSTKRLVLPD